MESLPTWPICDLAAMLRVYFLNTQFVLQVPCVILPEMCWTYAVFVPGYRKAK